VESLIAVGSRILRTTEVSVVTSARCRLRSHPASATYCPRWQSPSQALPERVPIAPPRPSAMAVSPGAGSGGQRLASSRV